MASVYTYSLKRDGDKQLSKNFKVREFACKDKSDKILICPETVLVLQAVRDYFGQPITITSGYRTPSHNKAVGGAASSQHVVGTAVDFKVQNVPTWAVSAFLEDCYPTHGIGKYSTWVHLDSRGHKTYWLDKGNNTVNSFGYKKRYQTYKAKEPVKPVEEDMTDKETYEAVMRYAKTIRLPTWAEKEFAEAKAAGITDGSDPCVLIPRYQAAIMALRAMKKAEK